MLKENALKLLGYPPKYSSSKFDNRLAERVDGRINEGCWDEMFSQGDGGDSIAFIKVFNLYCALYEDTQGFTTLTIFDNEEQYQTAIEAESDNDFWGWEDEE